MALVLFDILFIIGSSFIITLNMLNDFGAINIINSEEYLQLELITLVFIKDFESNLGIALVSNSKVVIQCYYLLLFSFYLLVVRYTFLLLFYLNIRITIL